ncbi:hypothetical protein [Wolbachia endosymbiont (group E) of Neria commutata]|uniref:hypothetical protein n=1 Tax=Wolbachia endosymbiont (group E) of Neria commutata TaxID=3066149 RepID=UPI003132F959
MSTLQFPTYAHKLTALSLAEQKDYTVLAEKIKAKMEELGIPDKEDELIKSDNGDESFYEYILSNNLRMEVLYRDGEAALVVAVAFMS